MLTILSTPEYNKILTNTNKVRVHLRTGIVEIYESHQDLLGKIENNLVQVESIIENKTEKNFFILQDAVFVVSTKGLDPKNDYVGTTVYIYAKNIREVNSSFSVEEITKQYELKKLELESELQKTNESEGNILSSKVTLLKEDVSFLSESLRIVKELKDSKLI
jgi:hypothetical protein